MTLDPVPMHRDEIFWTLFQCTGTKILDPVPVHRDEKFWTLFQCTGTKILDPVPVHRDENVSDTSMMSIYHPSSDGNATLSLGFIGRQSSVWGRQSSVRCYVPEVTQKTTSCPGKFIHTSTACRATRLHVNSNIWQTFLSRGSTKNDESRDWNTKYNLQESALGKREIRCTSYNGMDKSGHQIDECANWHCINENDNKCINITHNNSL